MLALRAKVACADNCIGFTSKDMESNVFMTSFWHFNLETTFYLFHFRHTKSNEKLNRKLIIFQFVISLQFLLYYQATRTVVSKVNDIGKKSLILFVDSTTILYPGAMVIQKL